MWLLKLQILSPVRAASSFHHLKGLGIGFCFLLSGCGISLQDLDSKPASLKWDSKPQTSLNLARPTDGFLIDVIDSYGRPAAASGYSIKVTATDSAGAPITLVGVSQFAVSNAPTSISGFSIPGIGPGFNLSATLYDSNNLAVPSAKVSAQNLSLSFNENFDQGSVNSTAFSTYAYDLKFSSFTSGHYQQTYPSNNSAVEYEFLYSPVIADFRGRSFVADVVQIMSDGDAGDTEIDLFDNYTSNQNGYTIYTDNSDITNGINFAYQLNGAYDSIAITYNSTSHRFWRIRHDIASNSINWETSPNGTAWTIRRTVSPPPVSLVGLKAGIGGGTFVSSSTPGKSIFGQFLIQ